MSFLDSFNFKLPKGKFSYIQVHRLKTSFYCIYVPDYTEKLKNRLIDFCLRGFPLFESLNELLFTFLSQFQALFILLLTVHIEFAID
jgi:hypothetical protein